VTPRPIQIPLQGGRRLQGAASMPSIHGRGPESTDMHCRHCAGRIRPSQPTLDLARCAQCFGEIFPDGFRPPARQEDPDRLQRKNSVKLALCGLGRSHRLVSRHRVSVYCLIGYTKVAALRRVMTISQPAPRNMILHQKMDRFGKMCRLFRRHPVTSYWVERWVDLARCADCSGGTP
jgi:hypothetical protein